MKASPASTWKKSFKDNWELYLMLIPVVIYFIIFCYVPMGGILAAFKDYKPASGILGSPFANPLFKNFTAFFNSYQFQTVILNTLKISAAQLIFSFPFPIILALLINEVQSKYFKKFVQTISYAPHFISLVVLVSMMTIFTADNGVINHLIKALGMKGSNFMIEPGWFTPLYVISGIWQHCGWNSIVYIAALTAIDPQLHEASIVDGANRLQRIWYINIPCLVPTIMILLIMNFGQLMNIGFEKIYLMQNDSTLMVSEIISTYVYKTGILNGRWSYSTAVGMFNSVVNLVLLLSVNKIAKRFSSYGLW